MKVITLTAGQKTTITNVLAAIDTAQNNAATLNTAIATAEANFAAALANHRHNNDVRPNMPSHHAKQRTFTYATSGEDTHALSFGQWQHAIDGSHACFERFV